MRVENLSYELKIFLRVALLFSVHAFFKQHSLSNPRLRFGCDFLPDPGNVAPFVRWNKQKERARRQMDFYGIEVNKMLRKI